VLLIDRPLPREELLEAMARARVAVHLPSSHEGAYLPALESMALGAAVVCPDCVGNRSFCRDGDTCLVPKRSRRAIVKAALTLLNASDEELAPMLASARAESEARALGGERRRFLEILDRVEELWAGR
jgi:glycosyltransferase involved in cell wall biosynthesis